MRMVDFRKMVDAVVEAKCGLTTNDLADFDLWPYYDECWSEGDAQAAAEDAALDLLAEEGFPLENE